MKTIAVVGCGFLGSIFTEEYLRRAFAGELKQPLFFVDDDKWERRNAANQNVNLKEATQGKKKARTLADLALKFERFGGCLSVRLTQENALNVLAADLSAIVDAVDNLKTRQLLYGLGFLLKVPVLHLGLSPSGVGLVEWSCLGHDTFHLAPLQVALAGKTVTDPATSHLPPCELVQMRGAGLATGLAGAIALGIYLGFDPEEYVAEKGESSLGWMTEWTASVTGYAPQRETWGLVPHATEEVQS